ncbi:MAG: tetratricopeptide repeat protein [Candidatus Brocadiia bacterium]|jgi:tetratricopeptide (TPR) repeat protein
MVVVPALLLGLLEGGLRAFGYGYPSHYFVKAGAGEKLTSNGKFAWRFFSPAIARTPAVPTTFTAEKPAGTYRIFVLGESAAAGDPAPQFGFSRILEAMLREQRPALQFEVINTALTGINSHVILPIARDCARLHGDLFIIYMGNNEVVGPFGPGTAFDRFSRNLWLIRGSIWSKSTRIGQLLQSASRLFLRGTGQPEKWEGLKMFAGNHVPAGDPRLERMYGHFRKNLSDICEVARRSGARVILCTVATNLGECAPFGSAHRSNLGADETAAWEEIYQAGVALEAKGDHAQAAAKYREAAALDDQFADLHFRLGRCDRDLKEFDKAREEFILARDQDVLRFRADTRINGIIREAAAGQEPNGIHLLDLVRVFEEGDPAAHGAPGAELFWDHVHMNFAGNYLLASAVFEELARNPAAFSLDGRPAETVSPPPMEKCAKALVLTDWALTGIAGILLEREDMPPFTFQLNHAERCARLLADQREWEKHDTPEVLKADSDLYRSALEKAPQDLLLRQNYAELEFDRGEFKSALEQFHICLEKAPAGADWITAGVVFAIGRMGRKLWATGQHDAARQYFEEALKLRPDLSEAHSDLGSVLLQMGKPDEAMRQLHEALRISPDSSSAHLSLGEALVQEGNLKEAVAQFRAAVKSDPDSAEGQDNLAAALIALGKTEEALPPCQEFVRLAPDDAGGHTRLAKVLCMLGRPAEAVEHLRGSLKRTPGSARTALALAWILATNPDARVRDGAEALRLAEQADRATGGANPVVLSTLGAACAEQGRFDEAIAAATEALDLARKADSAQAAGWIEGQLESYKARKPFHESPAGYGP